MGGCDATGGKSDCKESPLEIKRDKNEGKRCRELRRK
jgi:hypothetical protein